MTIAVLGASGMLGSMLVSQLSQHHQVVATVRHKGYIKTIPNVRWRLLDVTAADDNSLQPAVHDCQWVINAIGLIKQKMNHSEHLAYRINYEFPCKLAEAAEYFNFRVIHITTDCVYSGLKGSYRETDEHDAGDVYGLSKSKGEVISPFVHNFRCSIIGYEQGEPVSLLGWFLSQPKGATIDGYTNHLWNGITTLHFAKICQGIIKSRADLPPVQHVVPLDWVSKSELLNMFREYFDRKDIRINYTSKERVNRRLNTVNPKTNKLLWSLAGYRDIPTIDTMVKELAEKR